MENVKRPNTAKQRAESREMKMRAMAVLIVLLSIATMILFALTMTFAFRPESMRNADAMENLYQRNFYDLTDTMSDLEVELDKMMVAKGKKLQRELSDEIWRDTGAASVYLDGLPVDHHSIESTYRLVNQLGDYIYVLSGQLTDRDMTERERAIVEGMYLRTAAVNNALAELKANMGGYRFVDHLDYDRIAAGDDPVGSAIGGANSDEMPSLVYDGPFSDALINPDFSGLDALTEFDEAQALARAREWFGEAEVTGQTESEPRCWEIRTEDGYLQLTVKGGLPLLYDSDCYPGDAEWQSEEAISAAKEWAERVYGKDFECVWFSAEGGTALVNLAPTEAGTAYYSELVKIKINLADGKVCGAEAMAYLANLAGHKTYTAAVSQAQAKEAVNEKLGAEFVRLAVVPRKSGALTLAYEFRGTLNGKTYLSYVDATQGEEIALMRVLETEMGTLVQ